MRFSEYYQDKNVATDYDARRMKGIKASIVRLLERRAVLDLLPRGNLKILEAGVGTGYFTEMLAKHGYLDGIDISKEMLQVLRKKIKNVSLMQADILSLKLLKKYDCIVSVRVISHFNKKDASLALKNLAKCLTSAGTIIFNLENPSVLRRIGRKITNWGSTYTYQYSSSEIKQIIRYAKLNSVKTIYIDHLILYPLHIINKISFGLFTNIILRFEKSLEKFKFSSANVFIKCKN